MKKAYYLKESPSGAFFVMLDKKPIAGFHEKIHAEEFLAWLSKEQSLDFSEMGALAFKEKIND